VRGGKQTPVCSRTVHSSTVVANLKKRFLIIFKQFWKLAKSGFLETKKRTLKQSVTFSIKLFLILFIFKFSFLTLAKLINVPIVAQDFKMDTYSGAYQFLILALLIPVFEELTFRNCLKFTKWNFIIMSAGLTYFVLKLLFKLDWTISLISAGIVTTILLIFLKNQILERLTKYWKNNRLTVFYSLLISFSALHITNYELNLSTLLYFPILALPHLSAGFIFSYVRFESGVLFSIGLHILNNALFTFPLLFME
jgi:hypothetical protein